VFLGDKKVFLGDKKVFLGDKKVFLNLSNPVWLGSSGRPTALYSFIY